MAREWIYGRQAVLAVLRARRRPCYRLLLAEGVRTKGIVEDIASAATERGCEIVQAPREEMARRVGAPGHQGVALLAGSYPYIDESTSLQKVKTAGREALVLLLDHLQDPQNLGNLLRTAEVAGVTEVLIPKRRAAPITPAVVNASAGAVEFVDVVLVSNLVRAMERLQQVGVWVYALEGQPPAPIIWEVNLLGPLGLVVGSEGKGISRLVRERVDGLLRLPMWGRTSSLNAAVAGALALYEVRRQREAMS